MFNVVITWLPVYDATRVLGAFAAAKWSVSHAGGDANKENVAATLCFQLDGLVFKDAKTDSERSAACARYVDWHLNNLGYKYFSIVAVYNNTTHIMCSQLKLDQIKHKKPKNIEHLKLVKQPEEPLA